jgi:hypothetical protein
MIKKGMSKYTDLQLVEWILSKDSGKEMRADSESKYQISYKRKLNIFFPEKQSLKDREPRKKWSKKEINEIIKLTIDERAEYIKKHKATYSKDNHHSAKVLFIPVELEDKDGNITKMCGRCLKELSKLPKGSKTLCKTCMNACYKFTFRGEDLNPWNVRDPFIHSTLKHHEKTFHIGMIVDEKTQKYLTAVGYDFIFKEIYDEVK